MITGKPQSNKCAPHLLAVLLVCALSWGCQSINNAAQEGDIATVEKLLNRGRDPNKRNWRNSRPLLAATAEHNPLVKETS